MHVLQLNPESLHPLCAYPFYAYGLEMRSLTRLGSSVRAAQLLPWPAILCGESPADMSTAVQSYTSRAWGRHCKFVIATCK